MLFDSRLETWACADGSIQMASEDVRRSNEDGPNAPRLPWRSPQNLRVAVHGWRSCGPPGITVPSDVFGLRRGHAVRRLHEVGEPARKAENERNRMIYEVNQQLRRQQGGQPEGDFVERPPDITRVPRRHPMYAACSTTNYESGSSRGAAADTTKASNTARPHVIACWKGHSSVRGLHEVGAAADITKADNKGATPMHWACWCKAVCGGSARVLSPATRGTSIRPSGSPSATNTAKWWSGRHARGATRLSAAPSYQHALDAQSPPLSAGFARPRIPSARHRDDDIVVTGVAESRLAQKSRLALPLHGAADYGRREHIAEFVGGVLRGSELRTSASRSSPTAKRKYAIFGASLSPVLRSANCMCAWLQNFKSICFFSASRGEGTSMRCPRHADMPRHARAQPKPKPHHTTNQQTYRLRPPPNYQLKPVTSAKDARGRTRAATRRSSMASFGKSFV